MISRFIKKTLLLSLAMILIEGSCLAAGKTASPYIHYYEYYEGLAPSWMAWTIDKISSRSGPGTEYSETGTYNVKGQYIPVISIAYDEENSIYWLQCEIKYQNQLRRVYTGLKRFDSTSFALSEVPYEYPYEGQIKVLHTCMGMYGPGAGYATYGDIMIEKGQMVTFIASENGYAMIEWTTDKSYRAWVPLGALELSVG